MVRGIRRYFLRVYAGENGKSHRSGSFGPFGEAMFQTILIILLPIGGIGAAAIVLLFPLLEHFLAVYRVEVLSGFAGVSLIAAYLLVKRVAGDPRLLPSLASAYGTARDRVVVNIQFWCVLGGSLALPWIAAGLRRLAD